jgi:hypothetical protein
VSTGRACIAASLSAALVPALALAHPLAHEGPPYPLVVDRAVGPYVLSIWADPDVGTGTFHVGFDPPIRSEADEPRVAIEVWPSSGRLPPVRYEAELQRDESYLATVEFDREEDWGVKLHVDGARGSGELELEVAVTPPGYGRWDLLIYGAPFLLLGGLWAIAAIRRRAQDDRRP